MLTITGKVLDVTSENVNGPSGSFISTTVHLLSGVQVYAVRAGRDFPPADLPKKDETVSFEVVVGPYASKSGGASYRLTALRRLAAAAKPVSAVS